MAEPAEGKGPSPGDPISALDLVRDEKSTAREEAIEPLDGKEAGTTLESIVRPSGLLQTKSYATTASGLSASETESTKEVEQKPWYKKLNPLKWGPPPPVPKERIPSREYTAGFLSMMTFQWMAPLMSTGYKRQLEANDIWLVNPDRSADVMTNKLQTSFERRVQRGEKNPLLWAMHETFRSEIWFAGVCALCGSILQVMSPFTLRFLINFANEAYVAQMTGTEPPHIGIGVGLVLGITGMQMLQSLGMNHFIYRGMMVGGETRAVLISVIFEKAMKISGRAKAGGRAADDDDKPLLKPDEKDASGWRAKLSKKGGNAKPDVEQKAGVAGDGSGWGNGRVVNLMSVDTYRVDQASGLMHLIWTAPVACTITLVVLLINLTYSALAGFALLVIGVPVLTRAVKFLFIRRKAINKVTDQRVSLTQEILQAVRFVKYFGWEMAFLGRLGDIRKHEIHAIQVLLAIRNAINAVSMSLPIFASMLSFICYSLTDHGLNPANIFSSLALFNSLRMPLNLLPLVIGQVVDAWSSVKRIQEYLLSEDQQDDAIWDPEGMNAVEMHDASFTWERTPTQDPEHVKMAGKIQSKDEIKKAKKAEKLAAKEKKHEAGFERKSGDSSPDTESTTSEKREPFKLQNMDFTVGRNELVAVIGTVGSGKSSLLAALAGDMRRTDGEVVLAANRAFCPQYAWIQNASVRENILFGKEMNRAWYKQVIDACALQPDLEMLPDGDATEIGERGITVSGGQKQRLNIARAIYFDAEIVLMDDPLSAVDAHVGRHIFDHAITGLLKDKCRILATHQLWVLNRCDRIIWLDEGKIRAIDTFDNLMASNEGFQHLMMSTAAEKKEEADDEDEVEEEKKDAKKIKKKGPGLMQAEERAVKSVPWSVYGAYIRASGSIFNIFIVIGLLLMAQGANIATSLWLSYWVSDKFGYSTGTYIGVYAGLSTSQACLTFAFSLALTILGTRASRVMLNRAITRVLRAPMSFFDTTPLGRITNRFSRDVDTMDNNLTDAMRMYFFTLAMITSVFILIISFFYYVSPSTRALTGDKLILDSS
jgi:ATP-binding cassette subfamily C (CFTR/MRP) protein 1